MSIHVRGGKSGEPHPSLIYFCEMMSQASHCLTGHQQHTRGPPSWPWVFLETARKRPPVGHSQSFLCSCMLPHAAASKALSLPVLCFILALAECINRREHLAEWHHEMGPSCSAKYHRELFIRGINLLFHVCFVVGL